jgi:hypothetical protein
MLISAQILSPRARTVSFFITASQKAVIPHALCRRPMKWSTPKLEMRVW